MTAPAPARDRSGGRDAGVPALPGGALRRQRVRVPWRIVSSRSYGALSLSVYVKVAALAARGSEGCTAAVARLSEFLDMPRRSVERGLTPLINPDPDGVVELPTVRRTKACGTGDTAYRQARPLARGELWVWLPVAAADALPPRLLRAYAALAYAVARSLPITEAELGAVLAASERTASRAIDELALLGWITVHRRAGHRGRHLVDVHDHPLHLVAAPVSSPDTSGGSGGDTGGGSLATKEDTEIDRPENPRAVSSSAVGEVPVSARETPVDNPPAAPRCPGASRASRADRTYTGPTLHLSPRVWHVLEPVHHLLPGIRTWALRTVARAVGRQLDTGCDPARLHARLQHRYATTSDQIRDPERWLLGPALARWGCGLDDCEQGRLWSTGERCQVCAEIVAQRTADTPRPRARPPAPVWTECAHCRAPSRDPLPAGLCRPCRTAA